MNTTLEQKVFAAIADPTRRRIVSMLAPGPMTVQHLASQFEVSRPAISKHLRILKEAALVKEFKEGRNRYYQTQIESLGLIRQWLDMFWNGKLLKLQSMLNKGDSNE